MALSPDHGVDAEKLFQKADAALCRGKRDGRGSVRFFEPELDDKLEAKQALKLDLRHALERDELEVFYQPLVDTRSGRVTSCEALLRWHHPRQGMVPPDLFIPLAEETGMIGPIGDWVLIQACRDAAAWPANIKVAVNLSPVQFREVELVKRVTAILDGTGLSPDRLELEITESVLLAGSDANLVTLRALRDLGVGVALDDFGTGYSSLSYSAGSDLRQAEARPELSAQADACGGVAYRGACSAGLGQGARAEHGRRRSGNSRAIRTAPELRLRPGSRLPFQSAGTGVEGFKPAEPSSV